MGYNKKGFMRGTQMLLAGGTALFLGQYFHLVHLAWLFLVTLFIVQLHLNARWTLNLLLMLSMGLLITLHVCLARSLTPHFVGLALYLSFTTGFSFYIGLNKPTYFASLFLVNLFGIVSCGTTGNVLEIAHALLFGTAVAIFIRLVCYPQSIAARLSQTLTEFLQSLDQIQQKIFLIYSQRDYLLQHLRYEKKLHQQREVIFGVMEHFRYFIKQLKAEKQERWLHYLTHLENLFELIIALGNLRYRIKDHSTFEVGEKEFKGISTALSEILLRLSQFASQKKGCPLDLTALVAQTHSFEELNQAALQMLVPDPVVFLIFIQNLRAITQELTYLAMNKPDYE